MVNPSREVHNLKKVNIYFSLPIFSATKIVSWKFHVDNKTNSRNYMILGIDLLTALILDEIFLKTPSSVVKVHMKTFGNLG